MVFTILTILLVIALVILLFYLYRSKRLLLDSFEKGNCIVAGTKGKGKDVIFSYAIRKRKCPYYSNIDYKHKKCFYSNVTIKDISLFPNTYQNFLSNDICTINKVFNEHNDFYISDAGLYLPSQMDSMLHKLYPSLPLFYATSRHTYNANIHCNVQRYERLWKALREQSDSFITATGTINLGLFFITTFRVYEKLETACKDIRPFKSSFSNEYQKALKEQHRVTYGNIQSGFIIQPFWSLKYDTRAFHEKIFGYAFKKEKKKKLKCSKKNK